MIKLSIPAMFNEIQLEKIEQLNKNSTNNRYITEIYGSIPKAPVGTIRPALTLPNLDTEELFQFIKNTRKKGLGFAYIMNSTVSDGKEYTIVGKTEIIRFIEKLVDAGISSITITTPFLIRLVKKYFPELRIVASICAEIESVQKAQDFVDLGVDCIVPAKDVNRNFSLLRQMVELPIEIKLLATTPCLYKCSDIFYHMNLSSVRDNDLEKGFAIHGKFLSHTASRCQRRRLENPVEYIRSPWIRPEDLQVYEKNGISFFKLDGRDKTLEYNLEVAEAYMRGKFNGNLMYLMQNYFPKNIKEFQLLGKDDSNFWRLGIYVDNKALDGFINAFESLKVSCEKGCSKCSYCQFWSDKVIQYDEKNTNKYLNMLRKWEDDSLDINFER
ncbi:U32 family peptidase [Candidatus Merdisoma sp. JLR.KK011]|uniref:U32 family peptidase n=1 Tax=Candidatus Merdisoma sp. JLR.KK011 TaxID=3114299 RepID=UPI002FF098C0